LVKLIRLYVFCQEQGTNVKENLQENLYELRITSDISMSILGNTFQSGQDSVDDIINFKIRNDLFQFCVSNTSDLRLNIVKILDEISQERFELFLAHCLG
jgi:hypothetical protein